MNEQTQTVVTETDAVVDETVEESGAQDELENLLAQYDEGHKPPESEPTPTPNFDGIDPDELKTFIAERKQEKAQANINTAKQDVLNGLDVKIPDRFLEAYIVDEANKDPRLDKAFENRHKDPKTWNAAVKKLQGYIKDEYSIDSSLTRDRDAVEAAVHGASTAKSTPETEPTFTGMNAAQLENYLRSNKSG